MINIHLSWFRYIHKYFLVNQLQFTSVFQGRLTLCDNKDFSMPVFPVHHQLPGTSQTHTIQPSHHLLSSPPPVFYLAQQDWVFSNDSVHQVAKVLEFQLQHHPSNEYSELISFRMDWLDLLAVQGTLKSSPTPQFKSINSSALSFLYSPALTSIHDYWKNHRFD